MFLVSLTGFCAAAALNGLFLLISLRANRDAWPFVFLAMIVGSGTTLVAATLISPTLAIPTATGLLVLLVASAPGGLRVFLEPMQRPRFSGAANAFATVALVIGLLFASIPLCRPDGWTYHLNIAKIVTMYGQLQLPVLNDHIYFSGAYEYLFIIPRLFWSDDVFNQSFANTFSLLSFVTATCGLAFAAKRAFNLRLPDLPILAAFVAFAIPDFDMLTNAKPDGLLIPMTMAIVILLCNAVVTPSRRTAFAIGLLAFLPLALKQTWILMLPAICLAVVVVIWRLRLTPHAFKWAFAFLYGSCLSAAIVAPVLIKNFIFFKNPLHPAQILFLKSQPWTNAMASYWRDVARPPHDLASWIENLTLIVLNAPARLSGLLLPAASIIAIGLVLSITLFASRNRRNKAPAKPAHLPLEKTLVVTLLFCALTFVLGWSATYHHGIFTRFIYPLCGLVVLFSLYLASAGAEILDQTQEGLGRRALNPSFVLVPVLFAAIEVRAPAVVRAWGMTKTEFYENFPRPLNERNIFEVFNKNLRQELPGIENTNLNSGKPGRVVILTDNTSGYFFNGEVLSLDNYHFEYLRQAYTNDAGVFCVWQFANALNIRYILGTRNPLNAWGQEFQSLITNSTPLDNENQRRLMWSTIKVEAKAEAALCAPKIEI